MPKDRIRINREFSRNEFITLLVIICVVGLTISFFIIAYTPLRNLIPGYPDASMRYRQVQTALRVDTLERNIARWELYSENLRRVLDGEDPVIIDSLISKFETEYEPLDKDELSDVDSTVRATIEEEERFEIPGKSRRKLHIEGLHFFKPVMGTVSNVYEPSLHPYIDITAPEGSTVKSVLDGAVIYVGWNESDNWSMIIQHSGDIVSVYKNNGNLLKKVGDKVSAGTSVAILGKCREHPLGDHLHFELWQNGEPLNPIDFINF